MTIERQEKRKEYNKLWARKWSRNLINKVKIRLNNLKYRQEHKLYFKTYLKNWRKSHPKYFIEKLHKWRNKNRFSGNREEVLKRDSYRCIECGTCLDLIIHHLDNKGRHLGDSKNAKYNNKLENLVTLCRHCHGKLNAKIRK